jgi:peptidoglycan/LPS O-acetylase OafA/YrhL
VASTSSRDAHGPFRPDIEGLRAVAVLLVLAYHARVPGLTGGYTGVDVFFVVSGFLITGLIVRELESTGTVALGAFYARRARRLLPAALLVILVTVLASAVLLPPLRMPDVAADGAATAVYLGNIRFAAQATDYLQADLVPSPLLHFWSLGVEEQFYLFWPALLFFAAGRRMHPRRIAATVVVVAGASFALALAWTSSDAPLAFFLLPARAWELAVGAAVALATVRLARMPASMSSAAVLVGLALIGIGALTFDLATPFPGNAALLPVGGAALVIAGGLRRPLGALSATLAVPPMQWIGGISYSLYLWHWPLLILPAAAIDAPLPWPVRLALVGLTFVLAAASKRWVEDPIRHGRVGRFRPARALSLAGGASLIVAVLALGTGRLVGPPIAAARTTPVELHLPTTAPTSAATVRPGPGTGMPSSAPPSAEPTRPPTPAGPVPGDLVPPLAAVRGDIPVVYADGCHAEARETVPPACVYGDRASKTTVFLLGDSHAAQWFPTFDRLAAQHDWRLVSLTKSACPTADLPVYHTTLKREYTECAAWRAAVIGRIQRERPALVVISNSRGAQILLDGVTVRSTDREDLWAAGLNRMIESLAGAARKVVVIGDTPNPKGDPPVCLSDHLDDALACATKGSSAIDDERIATEHDVSLATGATFIEPSGWLCPTEPCPAIIGDVLVYRDAHHMTTPFAAALAPYLDPLLPVLR